MTKDIERLEARARECLRKGIETLREALYDAERRVESSVSTGAAVRNVMHAVSTGNFNAAPQFGNALAYLEDVHSLMADELASRGLKDDE